MEPLNGHNEDGGGAGNILGRDTGNTYREVGTLGGLRRSVRAPSF